MIPAATVETKAMGKSGGVRDWNTLREVAVQGYGDAILCTASIEAVERSNRASVIGPLNANEAGRTARLFVDAALFRVHIFLIRAYAPVRHADDLHLRAAVGFLSQPGRLDEETWAERRADLEQALQLFREASAHSSLPHLQHMRDKMMAHWARPDDDIRPPKYDELFAFSALTCTIWERLSFGAGVISVPLDHQIDAYRDSANAFWSRWETSADD